MKQTLSKNKIKENVSFNKFKSVKEISIKNRNVKWNPFTNSETLSKISPIQYPKVKIMRSPSS
jgi:hypothetical protein